MTDLFVGGRALPEPTARDEYARLARMANRLRVRAERLERLRTAMWRGDVKAVGVRRTSRALQRDLAAYRERHEASSTRTPSCSQTGERAPLEGRLVAAARA